MPQDPELELPHFLKPALAGGHPWVYRDHVPRGFAAETGSWVRVRAGGWTGWALWDERSPIALRVFAESSRPDAAWLRARVEAAWSLRAPVRREGTSAYRWINGEGDGLPAVVVDFYAGWAVLLTYAECVEGLVTDLVAALRATAQLRGVVRRSAQGQAPNRLVCLWGRPPPRDLVVEEAGVRFRANLYEGQKTGLFLDQRENRKRVAELTAEQTVLNLFAYTGGFSVRAALGGARHVTSVDAAPAAIEAARDNFALNGLDPELHEFVCADVFEYLSLVSKRKHAFDVVISDPPSFAHGRDQLPQAVEAYSRLTTAGLRATRRSGIYVGSSCTAQLSPDAFRQLVAKAAAHARCRVQIIHDAGHALDHPIMAQHLEGRYLKFLVGRVLAPT